MGPLRRGTWTLHSGGVRDRGSLCADSSARLSQRAGAPRGPIQKRTSTTLAASLFVRRPRVVDRALFRRAVRSAASDCACGSNLVAGTRTPLDDRPCGMLGCARVLLRDTTRLLRAELRAWAGAATAREHAGAAGREIKRREIRACSRDAHSHDLLFIPDRA